MEDYQKLLLEQQMRLKRGAAIIEGTQETFRQDGYSNMLNKYGTKQDNSTAYTYSGEVMTDDQQLTNLYAGNGLFANIIDRPSEEAVKHGLDIDFDDEDIKEYVEEKLEDLDYEEKFATAERWARLYGGAIIVMLVDDGKKLEEPLDWSAVKGIEELQVYERPLVQLDSSSLYQYNWKDPQEEKRKIGEPEKYHVSSIYGSFTVHRSRCLVFRNGKMPQRIMSENYRYWGVPEYDRMKRELRECTTSHGDGVKLLERSVQAIYSMNNLSNMLATEEGENKVLQRLQVIDMARSILNSIAIDNDGEQYRYETLSLAGVKDVIDSTCNMLSAVTKIPQTILFGRSPAGMNSTGESDFENYYNMVEGIQKQNMKKNTRTIIDLILRQGVLEGAIKEEPKYKTKFAPLWSLSESEQAGVDKTKADTEYVKAQTEQLYMDTNVLDATEVRNSLAKEGRYELDEVISDNDLNLPEDTFDLGIDTPITINLGEDTGTDEDDDIIHIECPTVDEDDNIITIHTDGGPGSGNWGHEGVPGKLGGSAKGSGGSKTNVTDSLKKKVHEMSNDDKYDFLGDQAGMTGRELRKAEKEGTLDKSVDEYFDRVTEARREVAKTAADDSAIREKATKACTEIKDNDSETLVSYDKDGNEIGRENGEAKGVSINKDAYATLHNHPGDKDSSFSYDDMQTFATGNEQIMYMTSTTTMYSIKKTGNFDKMEAQSFANKIALKEKRYQEGKITREELIKEVDEFLQLHAHEAGLFFEQSPLPTGHTDKKDAGVRYPAAAVLIINDGKILCARRSESGELCGPGGKTEDFDGSNEAAAIREAQEEFGIIPHNLIPLGEYKASSGLYLDSMVYFTDEYTGTPKADGSEMLDEQWLSMEELRKEKLFPPFKASLDMLVTFCKNHLTPSKSTDTISIDNLDGAPPGNQNAAGPHNKSYEKALKGIKTSDGKVVKKIDPHLYKRAKQRDVYPKSIADALKKGKTESGNTGNRTVYSYNGTHVVFDNDKSMVKTAIYKGKGRK